MMKSILNPAAAEALQWKAGDLVFNHFEEWVWLKPLIRDGEQIGITECCRFHEHCPLHTPFEFTVYIGIYPAWEEPAMPNTATSLEKLTKANQLGRQIDELRQHITMLQAEDVLLIVGSMSKSPRQQLEISFETRALVIPLLVADLESQRDALQEELDNMWK